MVGSTARERSLSSDTAAEVATSAAVYGWRGAVSTWRLVPASATRPPYMTVIRSHTPLTTARSWLISTSAAPSSATSRDRSFSTCSCTVTSSAVVGSSARMTAGSAAIAIASMTRCRWPPDSWYG